MSVKIEKQLENSISPYSRYFERHGFNLDVKIHGKSHKEANMASKSTNVPRKENIFFRRPKIPWKTGTRHTMKTVRMGGEIRLPDTYRKIRHALYAYLW